MVDVATDGTAGRPRRTLAVRLCAVLQGYVRPKGGASFGVAQRFAGLAYAFRIVNAAIAFLTQIALARWMGAHEYGIYIYVWTWVILLGTITNVGLASAPQRFVPAYLQAGQLDRLRGFLSGGRWLAFGLATGCAALAAAALLVLRDHVEPWLLVPLLLGIGCLPLAVVTEVQEGIARAYDWPGLAMAPAYLVRPLLLIAVLSGLHVAGFEPDAVSALLAAMLATFVTALAQTVIVNRRLKRAVAPGARTFAPGEWLRFSFPQFLVEGFYLLLTYCDLIILERFVSPGEVAIYYAATKLSSLVAFVFFAVAAASTHKFTQLHVAGRHGELDRFVRTTVRWTFLPSLAMAMVILTLGKPLLGLFGEGFTAGYPALAMLLVGLMARASIGPVEKLLTMLGRQSACATIYFLAFAANIALNLMFVPRLGLIGAAVATSAALVLESILLFIVAKRTLGLHVFFWGGAKRDVS